MWGASVGGLIAFEMSQLYARGADGMQNEKIDKNPAARIGRTKEDNGRVRWLSWEEESKLRGRLRNELRSTFRRSISAFIRG